MLELDGTTLTYSEFRERCLIPNVPAVIRNAGSTSGSPAARSAAHGASFHMHTLMERLSPQWLCETLGEAFSVPVYAVHNVERGGTELDTSTTTAGGTTDRGAKPQAEEGEYTCENRELGEVIRSWGTPRHASPADSSRVYYLKDWHMQSDVEQALRTKEHQSSGLTGNPAGTAKERGFERRNASARHHGYGMYEVPAYLGPDWMDPFCVDVDAEGMLQPTTSSSTNALVGFGDGRHDYRFAYVGTTGTWTVLHYDVFGTYSWSFNVCGEKLWFFPDAEGNAYLLQHRVQGFPVPPDIRVTTGVCYWTCVQYPGDLVFVPSQYYHQVHNVAGTAFPLPAFGAGTPAEVRQAELTVAVNHNWCNQFCIERMVAAFLGDASYLRSMLDVADLQALFGDDAEAWKAHFDFMLQGGSNWSFKSILSFLAYCERTFGDDEDNRVGSLVRELIARVQVRWQCLFT